MSVFSFNSWDALVNYVEYITHKPLYGTEVANQMWKEQFDAVMKNQVKAVYNKGTDSFHYEYDDMNVETWVGRGDYVSVPSTSSSTASSSSVAEAVGGGGVKSAPTITKVVTDTTTGDSILGETAKGMKDVGIGTKVQIGNLVGAIGKCFGLAMIAINYRNCRTWVDFFNTTFGANLPEDATVDDVIDFAEGKYNLYIGGTELFTDPTTYVPKSIVDKIYNYVSNYMEEDGTIEGLAPFLFWFDNLAYSRKIIDDEPSRYYDVIPMGTPNYGKVYLHHVYWQESLLRNIIVDVGTQLIGLGYTMSQSTTNILLNCVTAVSEWLVANAPHQVLVYKYVTITVQLYRDAHVPKSQPISPSEVSIELDFIDDYKMVIDAETGVECYAGNDNYGKFLKYGYTGENLEDFGYTCGSLHSYNEQLNDYYVTISFPSNSLNIEGQSGVIMRTTGWQYDINGYCVDDRDPDPSPDPEFDQWWTFNYCNMSYDGETKNYKPDDWLSLIFKKPSETNNDKRPAPNKTATEWYPDWLLTDPRSKVAQFDNTTGQNKVTEHVPVNVPYGESNNKKILEHGYNDSDDPDTYKDNGSQGDSQSGKIPSNTPIEDINEAIKDVVDGYDDSRTTPESSPDPIPEPNPVPKYPETPPTEPEGDSGDTPEPPVIGGVTASGMVSVYNPTKQQLIDFSGWLWSPSFLDNFLKIFANPMDAIIGLHIMYATPVSSGSEHIIAGYLDSNVSSKVVTQQYSKLDCGTITIPEFYGNATDYEPYTTIHIYLPFIGIVPLKANDVLGKQLHLEYGIDALTGTCLATLTTIKGDSQIACYTFAGNCAVQIPVSGGNYAQMITGLAGFIASGVGAIATGNPVMALGAGASFMHSGTSVQHSGSIGANAGACGIRKPYVIVTRKIAFDAENYQHYYGLPANKHVKLSTCKGYTQVKSCHVESIYRATDNEKHEIESLLKEGIIII